MEETYKTSGHLRSNKITRRSVKYMETGWSDSIFGKDITEYGYSNNGILISDRGYQLRGVTGQVTRISDLDLSTK